MERVGVVNGGVNKWGKGSCFDTLREIQVGAREIIK